MKASTAVFTKVYPHPPKWQHEIARYHKRGNLISYFLNNAAKTCLYGLEISENIETGHFFQSRTFFVSVAIFTKVASAPLIDIGQINWIFL